MTDLLVGTDERDACRGPSRCVALVAGGAGRTGDERRESGAGVGVDCERQKASRASRVAAPVWAWGIAQMSARYSSGRRTQRALRFVQGRCGREAPGREHGRRTDKCPPRRNLWGLVRTLKQRVDQRSRRRRLRGQINQVRNCLSAA